MGDTYLTNGLRVSERKNTLIPRRTSGVDGQLKAIKPPPVSEQSILDRGARIQRSNFDTFKSSIKPENKNSPETRNLISQIEKDLKFLDGYKFVGGDASTFDPVRDRVVENNQLLNRQ
jgi:hypothetical protein